MGDREKTYIVRRYEPCHLCRRRELAVHKTLDLWFCPTIINVNNGQHVPLSWGELVLDAMLVPLAFDLKEINHIYFISETKIKSQSCLPSWTSGQGSSPQSAPSTQCLWPTWSWRKEEIKECYREEKRRSASRQLGSFYLFIN